MKFKWSLTIRPQSVNEYFDNGSRMKGLTLAAVTVRHSAHLLVRSSQHVLMLLLFCCVALSACGTGQPVRRDNSSVVDKCLSAQKAWREASTQQDNDYSRENRLTLNKTWRLCTLRDDCVAACPSNPCDERISSLVDSIVRSCDSIKRHHEEK